MPASGYERLPSRDGPPPTAVSAYPPRTSLPLIAVITCALVFVGIYFLLPARKPRPSGTGGELGGYPRGYKLAVCYSGQVRTLRKVSEQNYNEIQAFDKNVDASFFLDLHDNVTLTNGAVFQDTHSMEEVERIAAQMKSDTVETYKEAEVKRPPIGGCYKRELVEKSHYTHYFMEFWGMSQCYGLIKEQEEKKGKRYDWILHAKPGIVLKITKPPKDVPLRIHMSGSAVALIPRSMANAYFGIVNTFYEQNCEQLDAMPVEVCKNYSYEAHTPECLIVKVLKQYDIVPSNSHYVRFRRINPGS